MYNFLYKRSEHPFGLSWENWAAIWCNWMLSIPKNRNPSLDSTGRNCAVNQDNENVWFLTGTFGNVESVHRKCTMPAGRAILFPILVKEDSFAEDSRLVTSAQLIKRSRDATDKVVYMEASIDNMKLRNLENYRAQSPVFDLNYPINNVYGVKSGLTKSVCDGFWLFIKPLGIGRHHIHFRGETAIINNEILTFLRSNKVYSQIHDHIGRSSTFKLNVSYEITICE
jgi:hypothetical protein